MSKIKPSPDSNRLIAVVTGANGGFGQGICNQLLRALSMPSGYPVYASTPQITATPPSLRYLFSTNQAAVDDDTKQVPSDPPPTLTLVLACRSENAGEEAKRDILAIHDKELEKRRKGGMPVRQGWREGLRIDVQQLDMDSPAAVLDFCQRLRSKYPHITSLFLNAGMGAFDRIDWMSMGKQLFVDGPIYTFSRPNYQSEQSGVMSRDGDRGKVWGVNVLANYMICKELEDLMSKSPTSLPLPPRAVLTSSATATWSSLEMNKLDDVELVSWKKTYSATKYLGELVMSNLDREAAIRANKLEDDEDAQQVRYLIAEPGCIQSNIATALLSHNGSLYLAVMTFFNMLTFALARIILGSDQHPIDGTDGAIGMMYAASVDERYLLPGDQVPAPKLNSTSQRFKPSIVTYMEVDRWEEAQEIGRKQVEYCEDMRIQWRRRKGLD